MNEQLGPVSCIVKKKNVEGTPSAVEHILFGLLSQRNIDHFAGI